MAETADGDHKMSCRVGFYTGRDGFLYCDDVRLCELHQQLSPGEGVRGMSPAFVYSRRQVEQNVQQFHQAFKALPVPAMLNFSMKANHNLQILKLLRSLGCGVTLVSGMEQQTAEQAGFESQQMLLNGSGKVAWEVEAAVRSNVLLNVDSEFDLHLIIGVCRQLGEGTTARVLLRLNLDIDPKVHSYVCTGTADSKFGLDPTALTRVVNLLTSADCPVRVEGLHCHLGSTIKDTGVFRDSVGRLLEQRQELKAKGLGDLCIINVGGGLTIDYTRYRDETMPFRKEEDETKKDLHRFLDYLKHEAGVQSDQQTTSVYRCAIEIINSYVRERVPRSTLVAELGELLQRLNIADFVHNTFPAIWRPQERVPTPGDLVESLAEVLVMPRDKEVTVMLEPGRAILGNAGALLTTVLGCKTSGSTTFLVVDGAMNDVIRPSLYGAYHHVSPACSHPRSAGNSIGSLLSLDHQAEPPPRTHHCVLDVVGPVCESGDFLAKDRLFPLPAPGTCVVLHDAGAYCSSMASNYNLRPRVAEVLVEGSHWTLIRRADTLDDLLAPYKLH